MRTVRTRKNPETEDLDLAPMLAMIVSLIPILLMAFSFYQTSVIKTQAPKPGSKSAKNNKPQLSALLEMNSKGSMSLVVKRGKKVVVRNRIPARSGNYDYPRLKTAIARLRSKYPQIRRLELSPSRQVKYQQIIKTIDQTRTKNQSTTQPGSKQDKLFENVVFANVFKG